MSDITELVYFEHVKFNWSIEMYSLFFQNDFVLTYSKDPWFLFSSLRNFLYPYCHGIEHDWER